MNTRRLLLYESSLDHTIEEVVAVFGDVIPPGLDLIKAEPFCTYYETTIRPTGELHTRAKIAELVCEDTAIEFRVNGTYRKLPVEIALGDKIALLVVSPPPHLRRVTVQLRGVELLRDMV